MPSAVVALVLFACGPATDPEAMPSPTATTSTARLPTSPTTPSAATSDTTPVPSGPRDDSSTTTDVRPPLSVEPVDVPAPTAADLVALVTDLSDLDLRVLQQAQDASGPDEVQQIGAQRYVGDGLIAFTEFATAMLAGVDLPDEPLPVSDVEVLAQGPGCVVARHVRGDQPPVVERLVATGTTQDPAWRVERTLTADQLDPAHACPAA